MKTKSRLIGENFSQLSLHRWLKSVSWHHQNLLFSLLLLHKESDSGIWYQIYIAESGFRHFSGPLLWWEFPFQDDIYFPWRQTTRPCALRSLPRMSWVGSHPWWQRMKPYLYLVHCHPLDCFYGEDCPFSISDVIECHASSVSWKVAQNPQGIKLSDWFHCVQRYPATISGLSFSHPLLENSQP